MKPTADNVKLILDRFFANVKLVMVGHNLPDPMIKSGGPATIDKANKGYVIVSCSDNAQFIEDEEEEYYIETLKHYPPTYQDPPETVETFYRAYTDAETAARDLIDFWVKDYWDWALDGINEELVYQKRVASAEYPRGEGAQADGQG